MRRRSSEPPAGPTPPTPSADRPAAHGRPGRPRAAALLRAALASLLFLPFTAVGPAAADDWAPVEPPMTTPWTDEVSPDNALPEYPRPQMVREDWLNLNGLWEWAPAREGEAPPFGRTLDRRILVPYPVESALSGIAEDHDHMWYRRTFTVPDSWDGRRVVLNFDAVDWRARVWVNGTEVGDHSGGYDRFSLDVTDALREGGNEVVVGVHDPTDGGGQPVGKQRDEPGGIFYTSYTGIWQTVWLEPVAPAHTTRVDLTPDLPGETLDAVVHAERARGATARVTVLDGDTVVGTATGAPGTGIAVPVPDPRPWSPDDPFLYDVEVTLERGGRVHDRVESYTGMRSIGTEEVDGVLRPVLNGEYVFQVGTLDQGYWPDGVSTAPTDEALRFDIQAHLDLGYNTIRKHVKVEPDRWYHWADRMGLIVWQDMPSMAHAPDQAAQEQFETELREMVDQHRSFPSITQWIPFNEGWGQYDGARIADEVAAIDPSRLVTGASGWYDTGNGDVIDSHIYVGPGDPTPATDERISVLGEFGGLGLRVQGHEWSPGDGFGYAMVSDREALTHRYVGLMAGVQRLERTNGLSASIYTEITDVENELNGLWTYDRQELKVDADQVRAAHEDLIAGRPIGGTADLPEDEYRSLRVTTPGHTDRYVRHRDALGFTEPVDGDSSDLLKQDATWRIVAGLADDACYSLESRNHPGEYLRHRESRVYREAPDGSELFRRDATWCAVPGLSGTGVSLRSYNFPDQYLRHHDSELWLAGMGGPEPYETSHLFFEDASWAVEDPWAAP
ncbi:AbfB domain-containing protein [Nocardiopsis sp. HUAS JQ3]|uniref:AbfB domain-containing protein n=1 Tax=Nocardiopsis sp. HUAS JQ3 TaxID=3061629 RepID=UPI0023A9E2FD|nr:AbfB domain-containing protein [Nocardiopsis sp. HUAS JQ3]WDZ93436.1 AbfB domain-containing protein [Nocardiopsis sp. HUAS JQ3]